MSIIEVRQLKKTYETYKKEPGFWNSIKSLFHREKIFTQAVAGFDFSIEQGEFVGFLGPNGAGKTTTLKMLSGILYPSAGEATVLGHVPWRREPAFQKQFALVMGQKNQLWWDLPAMESFLLNKEIYDVPDRAFKRSLEELLTLLEINDIVDMPVRKLSLGQRMKAELVAALLHSPKVLFLDEPTIGLDVISQNNIREFLKKYNREKKTTILLTSHYMDDVEALCKRVIMINHGQLMYDGDLSTLKSRFVDIKRIEVTFTEDVLADRLKGLGKISERSARRAMFEVPLARVKEVAVQLLTTFPVDDVLIKEVEIDEVIRRAFVSQKPKSEKSLS